MKQYKNTPYMIDELGNVFRIGKQKPLTPDVVKRGYQRVTLCVEGKTQRHSVHRMVAETFIPNPESKPHINHIDNNPSNNTVSNLEWCTHSENMLHCYKQDRCSSLVASEKAALVSREKTETLFKNLLGSLFVAINYKTLKSTQRAYVTYACQNCGHLRELRSDSPIFKQSRFLCKNCV